MSAAKKVALVLLLMGGALALTWWQVREREVQIHLSGQVAALPAAAPGQEPERLEVSVWFPELRLLSQADGVHSYAEGISRARTVPGRIGPGVKYRAVVKPDGHFEVNLGFRTRQLPTRCTVEFARDPFVTRRLRALALQPGPQGLVGTASDTAPYQRRRSASTD